MSRKTIKYLSIFIITILINSCATHKINYSQSSKNWDVNTNETTQEIEHTFYLIGDAGNAKMNEGLNHFNLLKKEISSASKNATLLFLGDNLYEKGMPKKKHPLRKLSEHRLDAQIQLVKNFKGQPIFIPGNHDYYSDGINGLKREQKYIIKKLNDKNAFLPQDGCPIKKVNISDDVVLIIVDSQWYLENWDKNPTMNDDCDIKTRELFFDEFESLIKKNASKTTIIALHHPLFSNGSHGGQFSFKSQFFPINKKMPLPLIGTFTNLLRKTSGISPQDLNNKYYLELKKRLVTISQEASNVIFVSGHEHNLQYIEKDNLPQIVSGSGSKTSAVRTINGSEFSYGELGYAKLVVYKNGSSWVYFYTEQNGKQQLLFKKEIYQPLKSKKIYNYPNNFPQTISSSIYGTDEISKSQIFKKLWGKHYRKYYGTKIAAPTVLLDTLFGGLTPVRKGGGHQSRSLRLEDERRQTICNASFTKKCNSVFASRCFQKSIY